MQFETRNDLLEAMDAIDEYCRQQEPYNLDVIKHEAAVVYAREVINRYDNDEITAKDAANTIDSYLFRFRRDLIVHMLENKPREKKHPVIRHF